MSTIRLHRRSLSLPVLAGSLVGLLYSQSSAPNSAKPSSTFQKNVRVVLLDVVVTDSKDHPVQGLPKENFEAFEEGKPQTILSFEEHKGAPPVQAKIPPMPPDVFTNFPTSTPPDTINVLLMDALNTPVADQAYVHSQMVKYLKKIQPGMQLAIFTLASRLRFVQGFTTDSSVLLAALNDKKRGASPQLSPLLRTSTENNTDQQLLADMASAQASQGAIQALQQFQADTATFRTDSRIIITLQAFQQLAHYLAGFPGRKNIIWFSSSFPLSVFPDPTLQDSFDIMRQYGDQIRSTADLLTDAQVAIYPIAAEGLDTDPTYEASSIPAGVTGGYTALQHQNKELQDASRERIANHDTLDEIAKDSGGEAFYNTNGLNDALARVLRNGARYYTLSYTPTDKRMDGSFRHIEIKLRDGKYKLSYRRGYFTEDAKKPVAVNPPDPLRPLMEPGLPDFSQILYKIKVTPSNPQPAAGAVQAGDNTKLKGPVTRYSADFAISTKDVKFDITPDGMHHGNIEISLVAYDHDANPLDWLVRTTEMSVTPQLYAAYLQDGVQMHEEIDIPKGAIYLRTGVYDPASKKVGSLEIPLGEVNAAATPATATPTAAQALPQLANIRVPFMSRVVPSLPTPAVLLANTEPPNPSAIAPADSADADRRGPPSALTATGIVELESARLKLDSAIRSYCEARAGASKYSSALANVCEFALSSREELPDIICHREMRRSKRDVVTAEVRYSHGQEYYDDIQINRKPVDINDAEWSGNWSDGEFGTILQGLFYPRSNAAFQFKKEEVLRSTRALVFQFHVDQRNNKSYRLRSGQSPEGTLAWFPDYHGRFWLDNRTFRLLRLERETDHMRKYPITFMETRIDYAYVPLGDGSNFVLPTNSDVRICSASQSDKCSHSIIKFSNWHKFRAKTRILMDATK
jgi:VWFA-related protein